MIYINNIEIKHVYDKAGCLIETIDGRGSVTARYIYSTYGKHSHDEGNRVEIFGYNDRDGVITEVNFDKHGKEVMDAFGKNSYNIKDYLSDANHVVQNGTYVPEMNGFVKLVGGKGSAKYAFTGLDRRTGNITTFHLKSVSELQKKAPSLGLMK